MLVKIYKSFVKLNHKINAVYFIIKYSINFILDIWDTVYTIKPKVNASKKKKKTAEIFDHINLQQPFLSL